MPSPRFDCDRCGLCCRSIGGIPQLKQYDRGDGVCCHLTDANLCDMYESRPEVCNVEKMYSRFAREMTRNEYYSMMQDACECLKKRSTDTCSEENASSIVDELLCKIPEASLSRLANEITPTNHRQTSGIVGIVSLKEYPASVNGQGPFVRRG